MGSAEVALWVYGTLREGGSRHAMLGGARKVETARLGGFRLYDLGGYPGAVRGEGTIVAERYALPHPAALLLLDDVEGTRERPPLFRREAERDAQIYVYARDPGAAPLIASGDWLARR